MYHQNRLKTVLLVKYNLIIFLRHNLARFDQCGRLIIITTVMFRIFQSTQNITPFGVPILLSFLTSPPPEWMTNGLVPIVFDFTSFWFL